MHHLKAKRQIISKHTYQLHLKRDRKISVNYFNIQVAALKFLYRVTLKRNRNIELIPYHKRSKKLPVVLSQEEVVQLYKVVGYIKHKAMILTLYSTGMRASKRPPAKEVASFWQ